MINSVCTVSLVWGKVFLMSRKESSGIVLTFTVVSITKRADTTHELKWWYPYWCGFSLWYLSARTIRTHQPISGCSLKVNKDLELEGMCRRNTVHQTSLVFCLDISFFFFCFIIDLGSTLFYNNQIICKSKSWPVAIANGLSMINFATSYRF